jgi:hypothetical protein
LCEARSAPRHPDRDAEPAVTKRSLPGLSRTGRSTTPSKGGQRVQGLLACALLGAAGLAHAAELKPATLTAWGGYVEQAQRRIATEQTSVDLRTGFGAPGTQALMVTLNYWLGL